MDSTTELMEALSQITREKGIDKQIIFEAIETSLVSACKKNFGANANIKVHIDEKTGKVKVVNQKEIVEVVEDEVTQISLQESRKYKIDYEIGDIVEIEVAPKDFGRISAQTAKQVVVQKFREAEREILYNEYITKEHDIITGVVQRRDRRNVIVSIGKLEAILNPGEQMHKEPYEFQDRIKVYILEVKQTNKGPVVNVSRTNPELVKRLFEQEVPEVYDGTVEVKSIARDPGIRSKMAVYSKNPHVDPVGACVGQSGYRVNIVSAELRGEKMDIIPWSSDPVKFIASALSPSKVNTVAINPHEMTAKVIVPDHQLSLAIGKEGQNARLAARLTGWRIDIKSETQAKGLNFITKEELNVDYEAFLKEKQKLEKESTKIADEVATVDGAEDIANDEVAAVNEPTITDDVTSSDETETLVETFEGEEYYDDEYYDDEYYDDEYYDDEYYDDEYYDDEYYDVGSTDNQLPVTPEEDEK
ncbi:MAG: transcription termination factor NusA [Defluviitaleaceae bacterium]|nr:transcription termination factor NusA [Defluviitaleaceae bacterium]